MKTQDLFAINRTAKRLNETIEKTFGKKLNLEAFDLTQLEDARNKLRTQVYQARNEAGFNENLENEALTQAQWMLDAINAEIIERQELVADAHTAEIEYRDDVEEGFDPKEWEGETNTVFVGDDGEEVDGVLYYKAKADPETGRVSVKLTGGDVTGDNRNAKVDDEMIKFLLSDPDYNREAMADAQDAAQAEWDARDADIPQEGAEMAEGSEFGAYDYEKLALALPSGITDEKKILQYGYDQYKAVAGKKRADYYFYQDEDFPSDFISAYFWLQDHPEADPNYEPDDNTDDGDALASAGHGSDEDYGTFPEGQQNEVAPPGDKYERMVKHIKKGYAKDGKLTPKEKSIAYATAWKAKNKNESIEGEDMTTLKEGEVQQASAIVSAKTMVDRVGRWIEDLSGMENDTLLTLGDSIRDEMSSELAKQFISQAAPALQQAIETLKQTRDTLASSVRILTGEEQGAEMIGAEPAPEAGADLETPAEPDAMNVEPEAGADEFAAAEPAAGGLGDAGRAKRESVEFGNNLLKVLAG